ncbi:MAG TPA: hypothetical protein VI485_06090 [Vicinamibacterales bacterium]|nr:hypothetical protein [Vicinamibacterales bacterium]
MLEQKMQGLQDLPRRFDGLESKVAGLDSRVGALESQVLQLRREMQDEFLATRSGLGDEIRTGLDETQRLMRVLHEDAISRIATMREGESRRRGR